jgi:hypothetical protein
MAQSGFTPIKLYLSTTAAAVPTAANLEPGELALNNNDGKLFYEDSSGVVQVLATKAGASGDVVGPASATANAIPSFSGTTGKLIQNNSGATISAGVITATGFSGPLNGSVGATTPSTVVATQVDITAQGDLRLQDTTGGQYVALQAPGTIATSYTLTLPVDDGTAGQALITDGSGVLSWSTAASGDVYGPASATDNAVARYDGTTGKIIQNSAVTIADDGATVIAANSTSEGLRITQIGTGNALLVEDAANPDATPFVVNASGDVVQGSTTSYSTIATYTSPIQNHVSGNATAGIGLFNWSSGTSAKGDIAFLKSLSGTIGTLSAVSAGVDLGGLTFFGAGDASTWVRAASILAEADAGTFSATSMPGRLTFNTTADGASSPTERMRIGSAGNVGIGGTGNAQTNLYLQKDITGSTTAYSLRLGNEIQSDVTTSVFAVRTDISTQAASFALTNLRHYTAIQGAIGAGSSIGNQYGFVADASLIGATNNYGFHSSIASGTGRWNFYAAGTADNFFGGATTISVNSSSDALRITQVGAGNALLIEDSANPDASPFVVDSGGNLITGLTSLASTPSTFYSTIQSHSTANQSLGIGLFNYSTGTAARGDLAFYKSLSGTAGTLSAVSANVDLGSLNFFGAGDASTWLRAAIVLGEVDTGTVSATSMPGRLVFATTPDGSATPTERMRITSAGAVFLSGNTALTNINLNVGKNLTGGTNAFGVVSNGQIQTDVTGIAQYFNAGGNQIVGATTSQLRYYGTIQSTISGTVTDQYGFYADASLTGAASNFGFYGNIASGAGRYNFYANGTAANVFRGTTSLGGSEGAESLRVTPTASGVNYFTIAGSATTGAPTLNAQGSDTNIGAGYISKGTGTHFFATGGAGGNVQFNVAHTTSAVNYLQVVGNVTGSGPVLSSQGSDTNINIGYIAKGTGLHAFATNITAIQFQIAHTASAVNYLQVTGAATGAAPAFVASGSDTNIDLALTPKGTGVLAFGTLTANADAPITGYITIKDSSGTTRKLAIIA